MPNSARKRKLKKIYSYLTIITGCLNIIASIATIAVCTVDFVCKMPYWTTATRIALITTSVMYAASAIVLMIGVAKVSRVCELDYSRYKFGAFVLNL